MLPEHTPKRHCKKVVNVTLSDPLRRVLASTRAQFSLFPLVPKSINNGGQKLSKWRPNALKNLSGQGLKKRAKHESFLVAFGVQMWSKMELKILIFWRCLVFLAQSGPTGLSEWILRAKMEPKRSKWEAKVDPMASK